MESSIRWREEYAVICLQHIILATDLAKLVTDMLLAMLNCCTKEELEEESSDEEESEASTAIPSTEESHERRKVIKNKILAVGRMARVFALLR